jgi:hypothetical protein
MIGTAKKKPAFHLSGFRNTDLPAIYHLTLALQHLPPRRKRSCIACDTPVTNRNLGGFDGNSALSGPLWCQRCADYPVQLLLNFNGSYGR